MVVGIAISAVLGISLGLWIGLSQLFDWAVFADLHRYASGTAGGAHPAFGHGLWHRADVQGLRRLHHGDAGDRAEHQRSGAQHAGVVQGNGRIVYGRPPPDHPQDLILPAASPIIFSGLRLGVSAGFIGAILSELKITPTGVGDIITYSRSIADYPSMYAAIFSIILLAVLFLNLLEMLENYLFEGNNRGYASD